MSSLLQVSFAKKTYHFKEPPNRSNPIAPHLCARATRCNTTHADIGAVLKRIIKDITGVRAPHRNICAIPCNTPHTYIGNTFHTYIGNTPHTYIGNTPHSYIGNTPHTCIGAISEQRIEHVVAHLQLKCNTLHHTATHCNTPYTYTGAISEQRIKDMIEQVVALLQHTCKTLQHTPHMHRCSIEANNDRRDRTRRGTFATQVCIATHCNTLHTYIGEVL